MEISITGASGDIGGGFLAHMADAATIKALVRAGTPLPKAGAGRVQRFEFQDGYTYTADFIDCFTDSDAVVHFAAFLNTVQDPDAELTNYLAVNALFTALLAAACLHKKQTPAFVYISSEMVYELDNTAELQKLRARFVTFCKKHLFTWDAPAYNLRQLARQFIKQNPGFPFTQVNIYTLTKYLGEAAAQAVPGAAIVRVACAYGPQYNNLRLIPRLAAGRLSGDGATYVQEERNFVYAADINTLLAAVLEKKIAGTIDCKPRQPIHTEDLKQMIIQLTPTAYGQLEGVPDTKQLPLAPPPPASTGLAEVIGAATPFAQGLAATLRHHKDQCYRQMQDKYTIEDFLAPGERIVKVLVGNSASYTFVVAGPDNIRKVRKIAIREGVEGNGIAKLSSEIRYYRHATAHPKLAPFYPKLLDYTSNQEFSNQTIEHLEGPNFYAALKYGRLPFSEYRRSFERFVHQLCDQALDAQTAVPIEDPEKSLNAYYVERALSRIQSIKGVLPIEDTLRVNGRQLLSPHVILNDLMRNGRLRRLLLPRVEYPCFHGDMTLLNMVLLPKGHGVKLIDPRGVTGLWDPLYDFAKLKFTLSGFGELILEPEPIVTQTGNQYHLDLDRFPHHVRQLHKSFFSILENDALFTQKIVAYEPHWRHRIALADAVHHLSDIPFRLFTDDTDWKAISLYVAGTYYLNQVYESLQRASAGPGQLLRSSLHKRASVSHATSSSEATVMSAKE